MPQPDTDLAAWVGRQQSVADTITATPVRALAATLDLPEPAGAPVAAGTPLPPLWHWLYFLPLQRASELGPDGQARSGGLLPPAPLPRRMWAGGQFAWRSQLRVGDAVERVSTIADVTQKDGRSGRLVFVKVRHEVFVGSATAAATPALTEFHDIVYREAKKPGDVDPPPQPAPTDAEWRHTVTPDDVLLFRYSALTFNAYRMHYDRPFATGVEGYPGLVVHGPLIATLLMELLRRELPHAVVADFRFKAVRPTFDLHPFTVSGRRDGATVRLWAQDHEGWLTMDAVATLRV